MKLPNWVKKTIKDFQCPHKSCGKPLSLKKVFGVGIREDKGNLFFCFDYLCPHCDQRTTFTGFPITLDQFVHYAASLAGYMSPESDLEAGDDDNDETNDDFEDSEEDSDLDLDESEEDLNIVSNKKRPKITKSGISKKEIKEFKEEIRGIKYHEDFLKKLGIDINTFNENEN